MMVLAWHRSNGKPYAVLHYVALPARGEGEPGTLNRVLQSNKLTDEQEKELDALPDGVSRLDAAANFYPYIPKDDADGTLDSVPTLGEVYRAIDGAVDVYRHRMRAFDGQTAQVDKENARNV